MSMHLLYKFKQVCLFVFLFIYLFLTFEFLFIMQLRGTRSKLVTS